MGGGRARATSGALPVIRVAAERVDGRVAVGRLTALLLLLGMLHPLQGLVSLIVDAVMPMELSGGERYGT